MSQTVTPELRQWIIEQSSVGCMPEAVLEAMVKAGWRADVAEAALEPAAAEQKFGFMLRMLLQSMEKRLETQPVYKLDDKDPNQAWLKENLLGLELSPGKIRLLTKPQ